MAQQVMAPVTARDVGNWLKWLVEQEKAGAISLLGRARQGVSMALEGANVALSYPGALVTSFLTGEPATVPDFRPYDPWKDPAFVRAQIALGRPVPIPEPLTTRRSGVDRQRVQRSRQPMTEADRQRVEFYRKRGTGVTQVSGAEQEGKAPKSPDIRRLPSETVGASQVGNVSSPDIGALPVPVTPVPDQILLGRFSTVEEIQRAGLTPTYFLTPALVAANADRPLMPTELPNVGDLTEALSQGQIPDQVLMGLYPNVEAMLAAGAQPTYILQDMIKRQQQLSAPTSPGIQQQPTMGRRSDWLDLFQRQQDVLDILGVTTETGQALRLAARRAAQTPGASVAALYWEQGFEPLLRRYGVSEAQLKAKEQELYDLEAEWRRYGMQQDFAEFLWTQGFDPFS